LGARRASGWRKSLVTVALAVSSKSARRGLISLYGKEIWKNGKLPGEKCGFRGETTWRDGK